jgi:broad specificity phosphatase PhoE
MSGQQSSEQTGHVTSRVFLIRHANASEGEQYPDRGRHLTEIGQRQAEALARRLAGWQLDALFCSDMYRAYETASAIRNYHPDIPFAVDAVFREVSAGDLEEDLEAMDSELKARLAAVWQRVVTMPYQTTVIVTHNGLIKYLIGRTIRYERKLKPRFHSAYTGITALAVKLRNRASLQFFNDTRHLTLEIVEPGPKRPWIEDQVTGRWHFDIPLESG